MNPNAPPPDPAAPPLVHRGHRVLLRDLLIFQIKLVVDGLKDVVLIQLSIAAAVFDLLFGRRGRPTLFYHLLRLSERFDLWLNLYGPAAKAETDKDGLFGVSAAGEESLVGRLEQIVTGKVEAARSEGAATQ